jgi:hypothetical protein
MLRIARSIIVSVFVLGSWAQTVPPAPLAPGDPVLFVHGVCPKAARNAPLESGDCMVAVSRQQFEDLLNALAPGQATPGRKASVAKT